MEEKKITDKNLEHDRRATTIANFNGSRTPYQIQEDVEESIDLLASNHTWAEIAYIINGLRDYTVTGKALQQAYNNRVKRAKIAISIEDEKKNMIQDLEAIMFKAIQSYNKSLDGLTHKTTSKEIDKITGKVLGNPYEVIKHMESHGDVKYLTLYMNALEKKRILLEGDKPKTPEFNINFFMKNAEIEDGKTTIEIPISSEEEAKKLGSEYE